MHKLFLILILPAIFSFKVVDIELTKKERQDAVAYFKETQKGLSDAIKGLLKAMNTWSFKGIPKNPSAWLYRVAKNKAIDYLRREKKFKEVSPQYGYLLQSEYTLASTVNNLFFGK